MKNVIPAQIKTKIKSKGKFARKVKLKRVRQIVFTIKHVYNNFFITASKTRRYGRVLFSYSGGFSKLKGNKRRSYRSAEVVLEKFVIPSVKKFEFESMFIYFTVPNSSITGQIIRSLCHHFNVSAIYEQCPLPHNFGPKVKKARRV